MSTKLTTLYDLYQEQKRLYRQIRTVDNHIERAELAAAAEVSGFKVGDHVILLPAARKLKHRCGCPLYGGAATVEVICFEGDEEARRVAQAQGRGKRVRAHLHIGLRFTDGRGWYAHGITPLQLQACLRKTRNGRLERN